MTAPSPTRSSIRPATEADVALVARRMRETLVEVLGEARGTAMYTLAWLEERVRFHLHEGRAVFVACQDDEVVGHTIVRVEDGVGLFSTTYVDPAHRRGGAAKALLAHGEAWMRERGLPEARTYTDRHNAKLIALYQGLGYALEEAPEDFVVLRRAL